jgi:hypothetical protein
LDFSLFFNLGLSELSIDIDYKLKRGGRSLMMKVEIFKKDTNEAKAGLKITSKDEVDRLSINCERNFKKRTS